MNWYKQSKLFNPKKNIIKNPIDEAQRFFNYLKSTGESVNVFHGTSEIAWKASYKAGYLLAPNATGQKLRDSNRNQEVYDEHLEHALNSIFFTTKIHYARKYAIRASRLDNSKPIILELKIPLYAIKEIQKAIFNNGTMAINESYLDGDLNVVLDGPYSLPNYKGRLDRIKQLVNSSSELSCSLAVPVKWVFNYMVLTDNNKPINFKQLYE